MQKLFKRRPSAGTVIAFVALCVALGGGAYAATSKKVEYKGLSKDARLKVLGVASTNANTGTTNKVHTTGGDASVGTNIVTTPQGGPHEISVACNETAGDVKLPSFQLS